MLDLGDPVPRDEELALDERQYPVAARHYLPVPAAPPAVAFFDIVERRRTRREFGPIDNAALAALLWYTARAREARPAWQHRPVPSAGGRHPVDLLILRHGAGGWRCELYDERAHALCTLVVEAECARTLAERARAVVPVGDGIVIWHLARPERTAARYTRGDSLIWRDAGAILGHMALVCEALDLNFCPVGATGAAEIEALLGEGRGAGVGGCVVGTRPSTPEAR